MRSFTAFEMTGRFNEIIKQVQDDEMKVKDEWRKENSLQDTS